MVLIKTLVQKSSNLIDVMRISCEFITVHRIEFLLLLLMGLAIVLCYMVRRRRSKTLSVLVARRFAEYKKKLLCRPSLPERLSSCWVIFVASVFPFVCLLIVAFIFRNSENDPQEVSSFLRTLHACASIAASFTAILMTIIIFTVTINSAYLVKTSSLFKFYLRKMFFWPVLAFAAGTVCACLINSIVINYSESWSLATVTVLVFMGCLVIFFDMLLLYKAVQTLEPSTLSEFLGESFVVAHRISLLSHLRRTLAKNTCIESMEKLGFMSNPLGLYDSSKHATYTVKSRGLFVNDVYFGPLEKLAKKWNLQTIIRDERQRRTMSNDNPPNIEIWPGQELNEKKDRTIAMCVKNKEWENKAQKIIDKAFHCGKKERWRVPPVQWSEISHLMKTFIEQKDISGVKNVLEAFRSIAADYLESRRKIDWPHKNQTLDEMLMSSYTAPTLRSLDFYNFIRFAIRSEDEECIDEISGFLYRLAYTSFEFESAEYFDEVLTRLNWMYQLSRRSERLMKVTAATVVRRYKNIASIFDGHVCKSKNKPDLYNHIFPFVEKFLGNILAAMRDAAKRSDSNTFESLLKIMNSLLKHYIPEDVREQYDYNYRRKEPKLLEVQLKIRDIKLLSNLVISAWLYRGVKESEYKIETVKPLINSALENILEFRTLIEIYLFVDNLGHNESGLDYDLWGMVSGEGYDGNAFSRWIEPFWFVIALRRAMSMPKINLKTIRLLTHVDDFNCQSLPSQIDSILENEDYKWLTGEDDLRKGKAYLLGLFGALAQRQRKIDYEKIITDKINERTINTFKEKIVEAYESKRKLRNLLSHYQCSEQKDDGTVFDGLEQYRLYIDKEDLTGDWRDIGLAGICGEHVGKRETYYYAGTMEDKLVEKGAIGNFEELADRIKNEAARLRKKGFDPQVVLIPQDHRYERMLTEVPQWERKCPIEQSSLPRWVTSIDGMEVLAWPHKDSKCVGVIDVGAFARFKDNEEGQYGPLNISFRNLTREELNKFLVSEAKKSERKEFKRWMRALEYDMDKVSEMKRILIIEDKIRLEILDCNAGVKFLPTEKTMGIVYKQDETIYHLPECKHTQEIPPDERRYFSNLGWAELEEDFRPCDDCRPNYDKNN